MWSANTAHGIDSFAAALGREPSRDNLEPATYEMWRYGAALSGERCWPRSTTPTS